MARRRRFEQFLSIVFLAAGAALLLYASITWYLSQQTPPAFTQAFPANPALLDLPPALLPAPQQAEQSLSVAPSLPDILPEVPLLPESPLAAMEETNDLQDDLRVEAAGMNTGPLRIIIPSLGVDAPVYAAGLESKQDGRRNYQQWSVPNAYAAGWHDSSASPGQPGNTVLNGHNNVYGGIFAELAHLAVGEQIILTGDGGAIVYRVAHHELLQERGLSLRERLRNARWIAPTADERLTLVTCWPNTTNSHRLIVVAEPLGENESGAVVPEI